MTKKLTTAIIAAGVVGVSLGFWIGSVLIPLLNSFGLIVALIIILILEAKVLGRVLDQVRKPRR